jgi:hypothetical protein
MDKPPPTYDEAASGKFLPSAPPMGFQEPQYPIRPTTPLPPFQPAGPQMNTSSANPVQVQVVVVQQRNTID